MEALSVDHSPNGDQHDRSKDKDEVDMYQLKKISFFFFLQFDSSP